MIKITNQQKPIVIRPASRRRNEVIAEPKMIEKLSGYGLTEKEIADVYGVTKCQFYRAMNKYRALKEAIFLGKNRAAKCITESLFKRAFGFSNNEIIYTKHKGIAAAHPIVKYYPPDMKAIIFWLKNRCPKEWREKVDPEKGGYIINEDQMKILREITYKRMCENM
jgi:hypothetical protein